MNTTEIFVEQVLIGGLVLLVVAIGYVDLDALPLPTEGALAGAFAVVGFVGAAYLAGIVTDRVFDSLLQDLERHARLRFVWRTIWEEKLPEPIGEDPFEEGRLRLALYGSEGASSQVFNYQRSRIRLARCLALLAPCLGFSVTLHALADVRGLQLAGQLLLPATFVALLAVKESEWWKKRAPPRTDKMDRLKVYFSLRPVSPLAKEWLLLAAVLLSLFVGAASIVLQNPGPAWAWLGGVACGALSGWAWWRMLETQARLLWDSKPSTTH